MIAGDAIGRAWGLLQRARIDSPACRVDLHGEIGLEEGQMLDPLLAVGIAAVALTTLSLVLARLIPDRYDNMELSRVPARRR